MRYVIYSLIILFTVVTCSQCDIYSIFTYNQSRMYSYQMPINNSIVTTPPINTKGVVSYESSAVDTIIAVAKYSIFFVSAGMVATGAIMERDKLTEYFLPIMSLSVGFMLGQKF